MKTESSNVILRLFEHSLVAKSNPKVTPSFFPLPPISSMKQPQWLDIGRPTLERPFGIRVWPLFDAVFKPLVGYKADEFMFILDYTPLATFQETAAVLLCYYTIVFGGPLLMQNRKPFELKYLFRAYNLLLVGLSGGLMMLFIEQMVPTISNRGTLYAICEYKGGWTDQLVLLYYINYLMKYLELFDTMFLILKKKPLIFLHTYHHGATALLCWTQLIAASAVAWVPITINLFVHVVMYWYYFQASRGIRVWWKRYITQLQITQFVIDIGFIYFAMWTGFVSVLWPWLPNWGNCAGEPEGAYIGVAIISSYLVLFIAFYIKTYNAGAKATKTKKVKTMESAAVAAEQALASQNMDFAHLRQTRNRVG